MAGHPLIHKHRRLHCSRFFLDICDMITVVITMKRLLTGLLAVTLILLWGCAPREEQPQLVATTLPVYEFSSILCRGTELRVTMLVTENISCLHDYSLKSSHMRAIEGAEAVILSGAGLEEFLDDALSSAKNIIDASQGLSLLEGHHHDHHAGHEHHVHEGDPHIWLSPANATAMAQNICSGLIRLYPHYEAVFRENLFALQQQLADLQTYGEAQLQSLSCRELITFHDGFSYLAEAFNLSVVRAVEEESGSEASASTLIEIITLMKDHQIPVIFTEVNGSTAAAGIIAAETGAKCYSLDMAMSGDGYFDAMYRNIDTLREALQ